MDATNQIQKENAFGSHAPHPISGKNQDIAPLPPDLASSLLPYSEPDEVISSEKEWLIDRLELWTAFRIADLSKNPEDKTVAETNNEKTRIEAKLKQVFPNHVRTKNGFNGVIKYNVGDCFGYLVKCQKDRANGVEVLFRFTGSPIRHIRHQLYPLVEDLDFDGHDNFLPSALPVEMFPEVQSEQMLWFRQQVQKVLDVFNKNFPTASPSWQKTMHAEIVWDSYVHGDSNFAKRLKEAVGLHTRDCQERVNGKFLHKKGRTKTGKGFAGCYTKSNKVVRLQITLDKNSTTLKGSGKILTHRLNIQYLIGVVLDEHQPQAKEIIDTASSSQAIEEAKDVVRYIQALEKHIPAKSATEIARQWCENGQIKFDKKTGNARKKLKDLNLVYDVGGATYKLVSLQQIENATHGNCSNEISPTNNSELRYSKMESLDSLMSRVDELTWEERLTAMAQILAPTIRKQIQQNKQEDL